MILILIIFQIYNVAYKTSYGEKPLHKLFDKVDGYIRKKMIALNV